MKKFDSGIMKAALYTMHRKLYQKNESAQRTLLLDSEGSLHIVDSCDYLPEGTKKLVTVKGWDYDKPQAISYLTHDEWHKYRKLQRSGELPAWLETEEYLQYIDPYRYAEYQKAIRDGYLFELEMRVVDDLVSITDSLFQ